MKIHSIQEAMLKNLAGRKVRHDGKVYKIHRFEMFAGLPHAWLDGEFKINDSDVNKNGLELVVNERSIEDFIDPA